MSAGVSVKKRRLFIQMPHALSANSVTTAATLATALAGETKKARPQELVQA